MDYMDKVRLEQVWSDTAIEPSIIGYIYKQ